MEQHRPSVDGVALLVWDRDWRPGRCLFLATVQLVVEFFIHCIVRPLKNKPFMVMVRARDPRRPPAVQGKDKSIKQIFIKTCPKLFSLGNIVLVEMIWHREAQGLGRPIIWSRFTHLNVCQELIGSVLFNESYYKPYSLQQVALKK